MLLYVGGEYWSTFVYYYSCQWKHIYFMEGIYRTWDKTAGIYVPSIVFGPRVQGTRKGWMEHYLSLTQGVGMWKEIISFQTFTQIRMFLKEDRF